MKISLAMRASYSVSLLDDRKLKHRDSSIFAILGFPIVVLPHYLLGSMSHQYRDSKFADHLGQP